MLIFVYGEDTFRSQEKVRVMRNAFSEKFDPSGMNLAEFAVGAGCANPSLGEVMQAVQSSPFLGEKRMVVVQGLCETLTKKDQVEPWIEGLSNIPESSIVILVEEVEPAKFVKHPIYAEFHGKSEVHEYSFPVLEGAALTKWVADRAQAMGAKLDRAALVSLVERVGADLWQMDNELKKLVAYSGGETITAAMVAELVQASFGDQIFALVDAVAQQNAAQAIRLLEEQRQFGATDQNIFGMLARQVRILLGTRSILDANPRATKQETADELGLHPFVAQKALAQARSFTIEDLKRAHELLFELDQATKSSRVNAELAVDLIVAELLT
ncbi:MAG: DNA polymerase III subunit delta [Candidatus Uhrbacteria bacterium]|nr:DNA polymerase III subunit delta [Patescibacteria group bacterium]MBU1907308.1 DNA polymerase III subunit delta [Patescibacteria group bacterium]